MPELPEVETFRRYLERTSLCQRIAWAKVYGERLFSGCPADLEAVLRGREFVTALRHGKYVLLKTDAGSHLVIHFGMTGSPHYHSERPPDHVRFHIEFENGHELALSDMRRFGRIGMFDDVADLLETKGLGPDALSSSREEFGQRLKGARAVKAALLDQRVLAGVGNLYADEVFFQSGIHPETRVDELDENEVSSIHGNIVFVLRSSLEVGTEFSRLPKEFLLRNRGEGCRCPRCDSVLERGKVAGTTTYLCPECQARRR